MKKIQIFKGSSGLQTNVDPVRISQQDNGILGAASLKNMDVDDSGRPKLRGGTLATDETSSSHSLFCDGAACLYVKGSILYSLGADYSATSLATGLTAGERMSYAQVDDIIYYANGFERGVVIDVVTSPSAVTWTKDVEYQDGIPYVTAGTGTTTYIGPESTIKLYDPPTGHLLKIWNGRMFIAQVVDGYSLIWYSERFAYSHFRLAKGYLPFESKVLMMEAVVDGMFVGTEDYLYFLQGDQPEDFKIIRLADYRAVQGTAVMVSGTEIGDGRQDAEVVLFATTEGVCMGMPGGRIVNLTDQKLNMPEARYGCGLIKDGKYICLLEP